ncbi:helix-turn-helix domain-containing protein [Bacillus sp. RO1]|uniref:helix-turn-helix domain-containing protein n=1 Tax=Bacillus sp. RO1 TaxID=2722703 RepID=UPI00145699C2|nr:helix-turn-helix domain-containing protein [Bacillus sp. RO1]NLP50236.1 helix-turn-helix domain-containing protein [Bacillus sp. RO1]
MQNSVRNNIGIEHPLHSAFNVDDDMILKPEEVSEMLGVHVETVRRWCRTGKLDNYNCGGNYIIMGSSFKEFMKRSRTKTKAEKEILH